MSTFVSFRKKYKNKFRLPTFDTKNKVAFAIFLRKHQALVADARGWSSDLRGAAVLFDDRVRERWDLE